MKSNDCDISILEEIKQLSEEDKKAFIKEFCSHTKFPNLELINENMKNHAKEKIQESASNARIRVISANYHRHCSATKNLALTDVYSIDQIHEWTIFIVSILRFCISILPPRLQLFLYIL